jgi:hypothetical protein
MYIVSSYWEENPGDVRTERFDELDSAKKVAAEYEYDESCTFSEVSKITSLAKKYAQDDCAYCNAVVPSIN